MKTALNDNGALRGGTLLFFAPFAAGRFFVLPLLTGAACLAGLQNSATRDG